ncbi:uncharacterized protein EMH_0008650 [Eimeria mitis]|uniref:Uncharacterized protein n=1 Tax=Eimeria mitis TaxID=44415 RepID=U6K0R9_9EIME|nr:uncharacterized protein EMH_0008650 [Eimeria mitis]CDJ31299.1 hypothetical protein, conserved [Eimeria mitis]
MLQHSASAVYLPRRPRDSSLGPRTFSSTSIGADPTCKAAHGVPLQTSLTSSTSTRLAHPTSVNCDIALGPPQQFDDRVVRVEAAALQGYADLSRQARPAARTAAVGLSDEETCSRSDSSSCRNALMHRASSFLASRRGSSEAFEDALESLDPPHPSVDLNNDYSSYAFVLKGPPSDAPAGQAGSPPRTSHQRVHAELPRTKAATTNGDTRKTLVCSNTTSMPSSSSRSNGSNGEEGAKRGARSAVPERPLISPRPTPHADVDGGEPQQHKEGKGREEQQERSTAAEAAAESVRSSRCRQEGRRGAAAISERQEGLLAPCGSVKSSSAGTDQRADGGGNPFPRAASQDGRRLNVPRRAIGRYSSVPAFSAADRVRIDRFKEGLPECLSTQEAINKQRRQAAEEERIRRGGAGLPSSVRPSPLDCTTEFGEAVDWRSLLDAAGLGDVGEDEITLEAEELHAKLQEFAPRTGPSWCLSLLGCLWQWRM